MLDQIITSAATPENAKAYADALDQYLFAEQLLLDAGVDISLRSRPDQAERIVGMMEWALIDCLNP
jgi:hypothetical protein